MGLAVLTTTPTAEQAMNTMEYSGQLVARIRITSPFLYPFLTKALAILMVVSFI